MTNDQRYDVPKIRSRGDSTKVIIILNMGCIRILFSWNRFLCKMESNTGQIDVTFVSLDLSYLTFQSMYPS